MQSSSHTLSAGASRGSRTPSAGVGLPLLGSTLGALWRFAEAFGQRSAAAEILELASALQASRPETAARMRRAVAYSWD
jgi:hypothetical protein